MSSRINHIFRWVLLLAFCAVIFIFSNFPADVSSKQSGGVVDFVTDRIITDFKDFSPPKQEAFTDFLSFFFRKSAHFSEYALLGALAYYAFVKVKKYPFRWLLAFIFTIVYACSDEFHQTFVPGRAGMVRDVFIDSSGALIGTLIALGISLVLTARRIIADRQMSKKS